MDMSRKMKLHTLIVSAFLLAAGLVAVPVTSIAQEGNATPDVVEMHAYPAHIHSGTCENLGDIAFPLDDLISARTQGTPQSATEASPEGGRDSTPVAADELDNVVATSSTTVEASLDDILAAEHAINVHESAEKIENYIACGEITGIPENDQLEIELRELNASGYEGWVILVDNGDGSTRVDIILLQRDRGTPATPAATPSS
jgi:hypothetical protein